MERHYGVVHHYKPEKGYGFLHDADTRQEYYFHISNVRDELILQPGDNVTFVPLPANAKPHPQAVDVEWLRGGE
jgi:cold shock CspA family protein